LLLFITFPFAGGLPAIPKTGTACHPSVDGKPPLALIITGITVQLACVKELPFFSENSSVLVAPSAAEIESKPAGD
jgi:hypothetical protein